MTQRLPFIIDPFPGEPLDRDWFTQYEQCVQFEFFEALEGDGTYRQEQKKQFLSKKIHHPHLDYPRINNTALQETEVALRTLLETILFKIVDTPEKKIVQQLYKQRIEEHILEVQLLQSVARTDMHTFHNISEQLYGSPLPYIFFSFIKDIRERAKKNVHTTSDQHKKKAAKTILQLFSHQQIDTAAPRFPSDESIQKIRHLFFSLIQEAMNLVPPETTHFSAQEIQPIFSQILHMLEADDWTVFVHPDFTLFSVDPGEKKVIIPHSAMISQLRLRQLIAHELCIHVGRSLNGRRSKLLLLGRGLHQYACGEEGAAILATQCVTPSCTQFFGIDKYIAIGFAIGLDGQKRNFSQLFSLLCSYYLFDSVENGLDYSDAQEEAKEKAYKTCVRLFRGTDCQTPGVIFRKDVIYARGNLRLWELLQQQPNALQALFVGKFDITRKDHVEALTQLGIL